MSTFAPIGIFQNRVNLSFTSDVPLTGWTARLRVQGPMLADMRSELSVSNTVELDVPYTFVGSRFELYLSDLAGREFLIATGIFETGLSDDLQEFTFSTANVSVPFETFTHTQSVPSSTWTIVHGLGRFPSVSVVDSALTEVEGGVEFIDIDTVELTFSAPFSGAAFLGG